MAKIIRARFNVSEITHSGNGGATKVKLLPLVSNNDENKFLWKNIPVGSIELDLNASNSETLFELGEYFVDFTKAD